MATERVAIVTGAGSGIGRAVCELLSEAGFRLTLAGRRKEPLLDTASRLRSGSQTLVLQADVSKQREAHSIIDQTIQQWGSINALVNNAAILSVRPIEQSTEDELHRVFATNTYGPTCLVARAWTTFVKQRGGCVINVSSMSTVDPFDGLSAYAASKAALESLTRSIANEGRTHNIRSFSVAPGAVETAMLRSAFDSTVVSEDRTLDPRAVAQVIVDCINGTRDAELGKTILIPSP